MPVNLIQKFYQDQRELTQPPYGDSNLYRILSEFKARVLDQNISLYSADVVFSTIHVAKGLEWDTVQLSDDHSQVCLDIIDCSSSSSQPPPMFVPASRGQPEFEPGFAFKKVQPEDDVNLVYVALTRDKWQLSLPPATGFARLISVLQRAVAIEKHARRTWHTTWRRMYGYL